MHLKRRSFSKEITDILKDARSDEGISKEAFDDKRVYIEQCWGEIVTSTNDCIGLVDDMEEKEKVVEELNEHFEGLRAKKELHQDVHQSLLAFSDMWTNEFDLTRIVKCIIS